MRLVDNNDFIKACCKTMCVCVCTKLVFPRSWTEWNYLLTEFHMKVQRGAGGVPNSLKPYSDTVEI